MKKQLLVVGVAALAIGFGALAARGADSAKKGDVKLPDVVAKTFHKEFPKGEITKVEAEVEGGVNVYDIEFKDGAVEKETDIAADGTMLEFTIVIDAKSVPRAAMKAFRTAAAGATMKRIERIEVRYETKGGKIIKLAQPVTRYAVEMAKGDQTAEIVVAADGTVVEPAKWSGAKESKGADEKKSPAATK